MKTRKLFWISVLMILLCVMAFTGEAEAQIFLDDESMENSLRTISSGGSLPIVPTLDVTLDQYAPIGGEILVLGCLGGAYLVGKRRKEERQ